MFAVISSLSVVHIVSTTSRLHCFPRTVAAVVGWCKVGLAFYFLRLDVLSNVVGSHFIIRQLASIGCICTRWKDGDSENPGRTGRNASDSHSDQHILSGPRSTSCSTSESALSVVSGRVAADWRRHPWKRLSCCSPRVWDSVSQVACVQDECDGDHVTGWI